MSQVWHQVVLLKIASHSCTWYDQQSACINGTIYFWVDNARYSSFTNWHLQCISLNYSVTQKLVLCHLFQQKQELHTCKHHCAPHLALSASVHQLCTSWKLILIPNTTCITLHICFVNKTLKQLVLHHMMAGNSLFKEHLSMQIKIYYMFFKENKRKLTYAFMIWAFTESGMNFTLHVAII